MKAVERVEKDQKGLKIDFRKVSGIQFDPKAKEINIGVVDELDYIRGLINHLWNLQDNEDNDDERDPGDFGTCLVFGWVDKRLSAVRTHIEAVLKVKSKAELGHVED